MLAAFKRPRAYRFVAELPMTATGKKLHYQLREQAKQDAAHGRLRAPVSRDAQRRDPVVTGIGAITPVGMTAPETWQALLEGRSGITPIESFDASDLPVRIAGEIHGFDGEAVHGPQALSPLGALQPAGRRRGARGGGRRRARHRRRGRADRRSWSTPRWPAGPEIERNVRGR